MLDTIFQSSHGGKDPTIRTKKPSPNICDFLNSDKVLEVIDQNTIRNLGSSLNKYSNSLKIENINSQLIRTSSGATDVTIICMENSEKIPHRFIVKFMPRGLDVNATICTKALEILKMDTPKMCIVQNKHPIKGKLSKFYNISNAKEPMGVCFMTHVPGANLKDLIQTGALFKINQEDWGTVLNAFGRLAVFDLVFGNDDRFYRRNGKEPMEAESFCNAGNVMIALSLDANNTRRLKKIFCIDNASSNKLRPSPLFDSQEQEVYLKSFLENFEIFLNPENRPQFAKIIFTGILQSFKQYQNRDEENFKSEVFYDMDFAVTNIVRGINDAYKQLADSETSLLPNQLRDFLAVLSPVNPDSKAITELFSNNIINLLEACIQKSNNSLFLHEAIKL